MKYYETLYIVKSEFEDDRLNKIQAEVDTLSLIHISEPTRPY